jgi:regulatory protein
MLVRRELRLKGVAEDDAVEAVAELDDSEAALKAAEARAGRLCRLPAEEARRKLSDFLRRRGFSWELTRQTLNRLEADGALKPVDTSD